MQITSESVKVGHPDIVSDSIAANIIACRTAVLKYFWAKVFV